MSFNIEEDKLKECKIVFDMFDKDKDGYITELVDDDDMEAFDKALQTVFSSKEQKKEGTEGAFFYQCYLFYAWPYL